MPRPRSAYVSRGALRIRDAFGQNGDSFRCRDGGFRLISAIHNLNVVRGIGVCAVVIPHAAEDFLETDIRARVIRFLINNRITPFQLSYDFFLVRARLNLTTCAR